MTIWKIFLLTLHSHLLTHAYMYPCIDTKILRAKEKVSEKIMKEKKSVCEQERE